MKVYFLRHGDAGDPNAWRGNDADRPLTPEGRERTAQEAATLARLQVKLDAIVTSPLLRARQTAEPVAGALGIRTTLKDDERIVDLDPRRLTSILRDHTKADAIMLVGHEPTMSQTIAQLIGGADLELKKGGLACIELKNADSPHGQLLWLIPPKVLAGK